MPAEGEEMHAFPDCGADVRAAADILARLRAKTPRVHCITNSVAQNFTANVLLAAGVQPSMTISPEEIGHFAGSADALLVNLGTFDRERAEAIDIAVAAASAGGKPWLLDPVLIDRSPPRAALARRLVERHPRAVRLNAAEFSTLADRPAEMGPVAKFAADNATVIVLSGATDLVADDARQAAIGNGHPLMARITAMGCAASALIAACLAVESDAWLAGVAGMLILGVAGEIAGEASAGPGSFAVSILDALYRLDPATLAHRARVSR
jgi:hydroxyethylthiazole kinase